MLLQTRGQISFDSIKQNVPTLIKHFNPNVVSESGVRINPQHNLKSIQPGLLCNRKKKTNSTGKGYVDKESKREGIPHLLIDWERAPVCESSDEARNPEMLGTCSNLLKSSLLTDLLGYVVEL